MYKLGCLIALGFIFSAPLLAHHGGAVEFDMKRTIGPITGTVTKFAFSYPHPQVYFDVKSADGKIDHWTAFLRPTPLMLRNAGWARDSMKPGDTISVTMYPHRTTPTAGNACETTIVSPHKLEYRTGYGHAEWR